MSKETIYIVVSHFSGEREVIKAFRKEEDAKKLCKERGYFIEEVEVE